MEVLEIIFTKCRMGNMKAIEITPLKKMCFLYNAAVMMVQI